MEHEHKETADGRVNGTHMSACVERRTNKGCESEILGTSKEHHEVVDGGVVRSNQAAKLASNGIQGSLTG